MISTRLVELVIDTVVCLTLAKWETVSGQCEVAHTSLPIRPSKSGIATSFWRQEGCMAPKPKPARFVFTVGMVLAMALAILMIMADSDLAQPCLSPIYQPQLVLLY